MMAKILSVLVVAVYVVSTMGFNIHHCSVSGTSDVTFMYIEDHASHSHNHSTDTDCCCYNSSCCSNTIIILTEDQSVDSNELVPAVSVVDIPVQSQVCGNNYNCSLSRDLFNLLLYDSGSDPFSGEPIFVNNQTFRV